MRHIREEVIRQHICAARLLRRAGVKAKDIRRMSLGVRLRNLDLQMQDEWLSCVKMDTCCNRCPSWKW